LIPTPSIGSGLGNFPLINLALLFLSIKKRKRKRLTATFI
jgi:hypothetical protein